MNYIGIDLGTTNSAICSYDGQNIRIWKNPDQNDVTPSAIFVDKIRILIQKSIVKLIKSCHEN